MNSNKKKFSILKLLLIILVIFIVIIGTILIYYKTNIDVSSKYDDKFDYILDTNSQIKEYDYLEFLKYDQNIDKNIVNIIIPKEYFYNNIIKIKELAKEYNDKYNIKINRVGLENNPNSDKEYDCYVDITYNNSINTLVSCTFEYKINDNNSLDLYINDFNIGNNVPKFIYKDLININNNEVIYSIKSEDYDLLKENILLLNTVENVSISKNSIDLKYNFISNLKAISEFIFEEDAKDANDLIDEYVPIILDLALNNEKSTD